MTFTDCPTGPVLFLKLSQWSWSSFKSHSLPEKKKKSHFLSPFQKLEALEEIQIHNKLYGKLNFNWNKSTELCPKVGTLVAHTQLSLVEVLQTAHTSLTGFAHYLSLSWVSRPHVGNNFEGFLSTTHTHSGILQERPWWTLQWILDKSFIFGGEGERNLIFTWDTIYIFRNGCTEKWVSAIV